MPKRSLNPGNGETKKIEQLNQAVEAMLARNDGRGNKGGGGDRATGAHRGGLAQSAECEFQGTIEIRIRRKEAYVYRRRTSRSRIALCEPKVGRFKIPREQSSSTSKLLAQKRLSGFEVEEASRTPR